MCFEALLGAHGVGPALALAILSIHSPPALARILAEDDLGALCLVPGVGKKTAARLLIDLKSRLSIPDLGHAPALTGASAADAGPGQRPGRRPGRARGARLHRRRGARGHGRPARRRRRRCAPARRPPAPRRGEALGRADARRAAAARSGAHRRRGDHRRRQPPPAHAGGVRRASASSRPTSRSSWRRPAGGPRPSTTCCSPARPGSARRAWPASSPARWAWRSTSPPAPPSSGPATSPRCSRSSARATSSSSTRSTASRASSKRSSTRRWRTSRSTSSSARARRPARSGSTCRASRSWAPPPAPAPSPGRCAIASGSSPASTTTSRASWRPSSPGRPGSSACRVDTDGAREIAGRARGTPRIANRLLRRVRDFAEVKGDGSVDLATASAGLATFGVDALGLDKVDRAILSAICERFGGGPVGLSTLAISVGEQTETVEDVYEPFLIQGGLLMRTPRGRVATAAAYAHLGLTAPRHVLGRAAPARPLRLIRPAGPRSGHWWRPWTPPTSTTTSRSTPSPRRPSSRATRRGCSSTRAWGSRRARAHP